MKPRLSLGLLSAIVAVASIGYSNADVIPNYVLPAPEEGKDSVEITSDSYAQDKYSVTVKDGDYTGTVTGTTNIHSTLYVREGDIQIGDGTASNNSTQSLNILGTAGSNRVGISIAGKNANVTLNKATLSANSSYYFNTIGSCDGNGTLTADNGSFVKFGGASHVIIGESTDTENEYVYGNNTTVSPDSNQKYPGSYTPAANGSGATFGKGIVTIKGGSTMEMGMNFYMSEGELNIEGPDSTATMGGLIANRALINLNSNSTANINISDGGKLFVQMNEFTTNYNNNTTANINIAGQGSELVFRETTVDHPEVSGDQSADVEVFLGRYGTNNNTSVQVTGGGKLTFETSYVTLGKAGTNLGNTAKLYIDSDSEMATKGMNLKDSAVLVNEGLISDNGAMYDLISIIGKGSLTNSGIIDGVVVMTNDGSITALDGASFKGIDMYAGTLNVQGKMTMKEWLYIDAATIVFTMDGCIDMQGYDCDIWDTDIVLLVDGSVDNLTVFEKTDFFINLNNTNMDSNTTITVKGSDNSTTVRYISDINKVVPEPSTATLSLLALATLASRRRRK